MKAFISGGAKNGKTTLGQDLAVYLAAGGTHYYVATMISADAEDDERIRRHIADRAGLGFETIECPRHILSCLDTADRDGVFLLDSVTALLQNEIFPPEKNYAPDLPAAERCMRELLKFVRSVRSAVLVSDYIFSDAGEYDPMTDVQKITEGLSMEDYIAYPDPELCRSGAPTTHDQPVTETEPVMEPEEGGGM